MYVLSKFQFRSKWKNCTLAIGVFGTIIFAATISENVDSHQHCIPYEKKETNNITAFKGCTNTGFWNGCKPRGCRWFWKKCRYNPPGNEVTDPMLGLDDIND